MSKPYQNNRIFDKNNKFLNRDNCLSGFILLKKELNNCGVEVGTQDVISLESADLIIYNDMPKKTIQNHKDFKSYLYKSYLLIFESEIIISDNWQLKNHNKFKKIFTWSDSLIDNKKYFKNNFSINIPSDFKTSLGSKNKFCCMIAGNHKNKDSRELYSERRKAINWFEKNYPEKFDLFGMGWGLYVFNNKNIFGKLLNRVIPIRKFLAVKHISYCGSVKSKLDVFSNYKFAICYENAKDIKGYVTEKIFDCFSAGTIPVYWGAPDITELVPENTFIDKRKYESYEDLYEYMSNMSQDEYLSYIKAIENYLNSDRIYDYSVERFVDVVGGEIKKDLVILS